MKQSFNEKSLEKFFIAKDYYRHRIKSDELNFSNILEKLEKEEIEFPKFEVINSIFINTSTPLEYMLLIRKLNDNIKRLYGVKQSDRHSIVKQVQILLEEKSRPISILRLDIKKFYESINKKFILDKIIEDDSLLSYHSKYLLKNILLENPQLKKLEGLPFGLNISATLSEIRMKYFDANIRKVDGVYFYVRYVDDIVIFTYKRENIEEVIKKILPDELEFHENNDSKKKFILLHHQNSQGSFDYLGYNFKITRNEVITTIANSKIKKIKSRIISSFISYFRDRNFILLEQRIKFLTGNYFIKQRNKYENESEIKKLKSGIYYNYKLINSFEQLKELNIFLQKTIYAQRGKFGIKVSKMLNTPHKQRLSKCSFQAGFNKKITHNFKQETLSSINKGWE